MRANPGLHRLGLHLEARVGDVGPEVEAVAKGLRREPGPHGVYTVVYTVGFTPDLRRGLHRVYTVTPAVEAVAKGLRREPGPGPGWGRAGVKLV